MPVLEGTLDACASLLYFLSYAKVDQPDMMYGGHHIDEVIEAVAHIFKISPHVITGLAHTGHTPIPPFNKKQ